MGGVIKRKTAKHTRKFNSDKFQDDGGCSLNERVMHHIKKHSTPTGEVELEKKKGFSNMIPPDLVAANEKNVQRLSSLSSQLRQLNAFMQLQKSYNISSAESSSIIDSRSASD